MKRWMPYAIFAVAVALILGGAYWLVRPDEPRAIPSTPPAGAPEVGSCWSIDAAGTRQALPWPGPAVDCAGPHTAEVYYVGRVDEKLLHDLDRATGEAAKDDVKIAQNLLYAQARRACVRQAPVYLAGGWHFARVHVFAAWIAPAENGFFGCALAEVSGPAAEELVPRQGSVKDVLRDGDAAPLAIACVGRGGGDSLTYTSCDRAHDGEFVGSYTITPIDVPFDEAAVRSAATRGCTELALKYLGLPGGAAREDLSAASVGPKTAGDWLGSDQTFACYLLSSGRKLSATVRGLGAGPLP